MKLRVVYKKNEPCVQLYNGPMILADGTVMACSCVAAMDAVSDLGIGNVMQESLLIIWTSERIKKLRTGFRNDELNETCAECDMYRNLDLYRTSEGRKRARLNQLRYRGVMVKRTDKTGGRPFSGG